jgi:GntR family transcriptional repressor for pyruvate dehydrogenase complex
MDVKTRIAKKKVSESILEEIRRMILSGELNERDKLPNQNEFAAKLGVSRPSLREALQVLTQAGAIEQKPGVGTVLVARTPALLTDRVDLPLISDAEATVELMEARRLIEVGLVRLAVAHAEEGEIEEIGRVLKSMEESAEPARMKEYVEWDLMYHHLIALAAHNRFAKTLFQNIRLAFEQFLKEAFSVMPHMLERSVEDHRKIYQALAARDPDEASKAMSEHISHVEKAMERYYGPLGS